MDKKITYGVLIIASLFVGILIGTNFVSPQLSPKASANSYVKAHSCDADGTCETNRLQTSGEAILEDTRINGYLFAYGNTQISNLNSYMANITSLKVGGSTTLENTKVNGQLTINLVNGTNMSGSYVCADSLGKIYTKSTPCR